MRRVAIFTTAYLPLIGGAEIAIAEITKRFSDFHFDIYTARLNRKLPAVEQFGHVTVYRLGLGFYFDKWWLALFGHRQARRHHHKIPYDFIWGVMASFGGLAARNFKKLNPTLPFLLSLQEGDNLATIEFKGRLTLGAFTDIFLQADHIQPISFYLSDWAKKIGATGQIEVIPNGVDLKTFKLRITNPHNKIPTIITTSRLVPKNGLLYLVRAMSLITSSARLIIVGSGRQKEFLRKEVKSLRLDHRIQFIDHANHNDLAERLAEADIFVRPSLSEGLGNAFLEAMAVGLPVVGTPVGGIPDFLEHGETGWLVRPADSRSIAKMIDFILDPKNKSKVKNVVVNARYLVEKKYDWDTVALQFRSLFSRILNSSG